MSDDIAITSQCICSVYSPFLSIKTEIDIAYFLGKSIDEYIIKKECTTRHIKKICDDLYKIYLSQFYYSNKDDIECIIISLLNKYDIKINNDM